MGGVETVLFSQNGATQYFGVNAESIRIDVRAAGESASCYGVNLAVSALGVWVFGG